jgi:hypothetical protein
MTNQEQSEARYVYCIISGSQSRTFDQAGIGGPADRVHAIPYQDVSAVVSDVPLAPFEPTAERWAAHEAVVEAVVAAGLTVLPLRFGTMFAGEDRVKAMLAAGYERYQECLASLHGRIEVCLTVVWAPEHVRPLVTAASPRFARIRDEIASRREELAHSQTGPGTRGKRYNLRKKLVKNAIQLDQVLREEVESAREERAFHIFTHLRKRAEETCLTPPPNEHIILNAAFLVETGALESFGRSVQELQNTAEPGLELQLSGPRPPYHFFSDGLPSP